mmetsp:Transcript_68295/g.120848  ORF Transcript_68295/g.120848 Transcript_68295/m.120848 type:complete len:166 (-) Transcript_68295:542-1039(-)
MGCNSSKNKDLQASKRSRRLSASEATISPREPLLASQPTAIAVSPEDDFPGPESYTDRQMKETELLKEVIHRTSRKFIDIGQTPMEATTPEQPSHLQAMHASDGPRDLLLVGVPQADEINNVDLLGAALLNDPEAMTEVFNHLSSSDRYDPQFKSDGGELVMRMC